MHVADALSRAFQPDTCEYSSLNHVVHDVSVSDKRLKEVIEATKSDETLQKVAAYHHGEWPADRTKVPKEIQEIWKLRSELYVENEVVFVGKRIFIPKSLQAEMMTKAHAGHFGIQKTVSRAKSLMYWPGMSTELTKLVKKCDVCQKFQHANSHDPLIPHEMPTIPFDKIGCDFCEFSGSSYLIIRDYFSKWIEVVECKEKTAEIVIKSWRRLFLTFGLPSVIIADNQPFNSSKCREFATKYSIEISTSSPHFAQSNGMAERAVQTVKSILRKAQESKMHYSDMLAEYLHTPLSGIELSPSEIIFGRKLRTTMPCPINLMQNKYSTIVHAKLLAAQSKMKSNYDRGTKHHQPFEEGEKVLLQQPDKTWKPATIVNISVQPRSYIVRDSTGKLKRRNQFHLRHIANSPALESTDESNDEPKGSTTPTEPSKRLGTRPRPRPPASLTRSPTFINLRSGRNALRSCRLRATN